MAKFKVGEKVRVITREENFKGSPMVFKMWDYADKIVTIGRVDVEINDHNNTDRIVYRIEEDNYAFMWHEGCFKKLEKVMTYKDLVYEGKIETFAYMSEKLKAAKAEDETVREWHIDRMHRAGRRYDMLCELTKYFDKEIDEYDKDVENKYYEV